MPMKEKGTAKLLEEIAELQKELAELAQVTAKKLAYMGTDEHPDGAGPLKERITNEMGDVLAAMMFVADKLELSWGTVGNRAFDKWERFKMWDQKE